LFLITIKLLSYNRHGQSAALQLIFAALGLFSGMRKSSLDLRHPEIWQKTVNKSIKKTKKIPALQSLYSNHNLFLIVLPVMKNNFQIWPSIKKVWPPLSYNVAIMKWVILNLQN
jgi:hypothetical protein